MSGDKVGAPSAAKELVGAPSAAKELGDRAGARSMEVILARYAACAEWALRLPPTMQANRSLMRSFAAKCVAVLSEEEDRAEKERYLRECISW